MFQEAIVWKFPAPRGAWQVVPLNTPQLRRVAGADFVTPAHWCCSCHPPLLVAPLLELSGCEHQLLSTVDWKLICKLVTCSGIPATHLLHCLFSDHVRFVPDKVGCPRSQRCTRTTSPKTSSFFDYILHYITSSKSSSRLTWRILSL